MSAADDKVAAVPDPTLEDAQSAAAGYRRVGETIVAVAAAIPALSLLSSLVRAPSDAGFDKLDLGIGVAFAVLGTFVAVGVAAYLRMPAAIEDSQLEDFPMARVPFAVDSDYPTLKQEITRISGSVAEGGSELAKNQQQLQNRLAVRRQVYQLKAAYVLRDRIKDPCLWFGWAATLALVGGAVYFLAIAPKPKSEPVTPSLVEVSLTGSGVSATGCPKQFEALQLGGNDDEPIVAVIGSTCTKGSIFKLSTKVKEKLAASVKAP
jgi:hypothetical protein